ncbi:MAG: outer membrane beta-barrel protein [Bacteroidota bacterium]
MNGNSSTTNSTEYRTIEEVRPGYALGIWGIYNLGAHWDFELGLNFGAWRAYGERKLNRDNLMGLAINYRRERYWVQQDLVRIPMQMRFYFGRPERRTRLFIALGGQAAYIAGQDNVSYKYDGALGRDPVEDLFSSTANLRANYYDGQRWQWSLLGGIGIQMDRASLSVQRNWELHNTYEGYFTLLRYYPDRCTTNVRDTVFCGFSAKQFRQTSLRFDYRLF